MGEQSTAGRRPYPQLALGVAVAVLLMNISLREMKRAPTTAGFFDVQAFAAENQLPGNSPFAMQPGVVADPAAERLYLMNPRGGIDTIGLASGNLLWTSHAASKPLAAFDDRLAAQAEASSTRSLPILLLDAKDGSVVSRIEIPMPAGVMPPSIDDQIGTRASVAARVESDGLLVWWKIESHAFRPIPGPLNERTDSGATLINLHSRQVVALTPDEADARLRSQASSAAPRLSGIEGLYFRPQRAGQFLVSVKLGPSSEGQPAVLKRWNADGGAPLPDIELGPGFVASSISQDGSLFLVVRQTTKEPGFLWSLYTIASGERLAEVRLADSSARSFFVLNSTLIYRTSGLHGLDLKTGKEIWQRALRDTAYHGSYPPRP